MRNKKYILNRNFSLKRELLKYFSQWHWFLISVFASICLAIIFLKIKNPVFNNQTTILIKEAEDNRGISELAAFKDFDILEGSNNKSDEIEIINSKKLIRKVVDSLKLNVIQTAKIGFRNVDIYGISPLEIQFKWYPLGYRMERKPIEDINIFLLSKNQYRLTFKDKAQDINRVFSFKDTVKLNQGLLYVNKSNFFEANQNLAQISSIDPIKEILVEVLPEDKYTSSLNKIILIAPKNKRSNVLDVSLRHSNREKANDLLDNLIYQYNTDATADKNLVARNTDKFINERILIISKELDSVEVNKVRFKKNNELTDIKSESEIFVQNISDSQKKISEVETQLDLTEAMISYFKNPDRSSDLLPANIGIDNNAINDNITAYNKLVLERNRLLLENATEFNPFVVSLNADITNQKGNLIESLKNQKQNLLITKKEINRERAKINSKISSIPRIEKDYLDIERQQNIKQNLYLFLLKKREENSISMAVTSPVAKVIDKSNSSNQPVFPKPIVILLFALIAGLAIPFGVIYFKDLLDTKVNTRSDLQNILKDVPVLGEISKLNLRSKKTITLNDRTELGESFRIIRTNFNYLANKRKEENKALRVFVTSTIKGEGKTFVSINTMLSLSDTNKKVLIIGADIRNPKLTEFITTKHNQIGLSDYLYDDKFESGDIINQVTVDGRDVSYIPSGRIPPNPSELLMNGRFQLLLDSVEENYDIIIIDTAPTMLVSDTLQIVSTADITIYITRAGYTEKELLLHINDLQEQEKIQNIALVLNGVKQSKSGYGYGYGYNHKEKSLLKKILSKYQK